MDLFALATLPAAADEAGGPPSIKFYELRDNLGGRRPGTRSSAARPGEREAQVLRIVGESPGITVREIGERLGVDPTGLYRVTNKLTDAGQLRKDGTRLHPVAASTAPPAQTQAADATAPASTGSEPSTAPPTSENGATATADTGATKASAT
jgi:hypothetical protein